MRKILVLAVLVLINSCSQEFEAPVVQSLSASFIEEGKFELNGRILNDYGHEINYNGFFVSPTNPNPGFADFQFFTDVSGSSFSSELTYAVEGEKFYYRAFAENDYGFELGEVLSFTAPPTPTPTVPCSVSPGNMEYNSFVFPIWNMDTSRSTLGSYGLLNLRFNMSNPAPSVYMDFNRIPGNGVYRIVSSSDFEQNRPNDVYVIVHDFTYYVVEEGYVYVTKTSNNKLRVEFCDLKFNHSFPTLTVSASGEF